MKGLNPNVQSPDQALMVGKMRTASFAGGLVAISVVAVVLAGGGGAGNQPQQAGGVPPDVLLVGIGAMLLLSSLTLGVITRPVFVRMARQKALEALDVEGGEVNLAGAFLGWSLIRGATTEGAGLLGAVAAIITGSLWALALPATAIFVLVLTMPKRSQFGRFVDDALAEE